MPEFFVFQPFFLKDFHKYAPGVSFQKIDPDLGVVTISADVTRLGAKAIDAEVQGHFLCVVDVAACMARTWHELGAVDLGVELGAIDLGAVLGTNYYGAEL